jgi:anti-sigma factor RsiW
VKVQITRNIIQDLLALYLAGDVCPGTRASVEEFLAHDPALAAVVASQKSGSSERILTGGTIMPLLQDHEAEALAPARAKLQRTTWTLALVIAFTLAPFSFTFSGGHITWMTVRDVPLMASTYWVVAAGFWVAYFVRRHLLGSVGV